MIAPVSSPRPTGEYATSVTPNSRQVSSISPSTSRVNRQYSICTAEIGCTAWAVRRVAGLTSDSPSRRTLPASTSSAIAVTVSSIGVSGWRRCR